MNSKFKRIATALAVIPLLALGACGVSTQSSETKIQVGAGSWDDPVVKKCIAPGIKDNSFTNDDYYSVPVSERDLDATGQAGSDITPITAVSKDNAEMAIPLIIRFNQVTDCPTLTKYFKSYGQRYGAFLDEDGSASEGYLLMLRKLMYDPTDAALDDIAKKYTWRELYNDAAAQTELQNTLTKDIGKIVDDNSRGHYFENFTVLVKKPVPTNPKLVEAIAEEQAAVATANSAEAKARATKSQAEAETATAKAEAAKQRAVIDGYGSFENYNKAKAVENGLNPYQPTYKVSGTN